MSTAKRWAEKVYQLLLVCYPARFRAEFGNEMQVVFTTAVENARRAGWQNLTQCLWKELKNWPGSVLQEHLRARKNKMTDHDTFAPLKSGELLAALTIFLIPALATLLVEIVGVAKLPEWAGPMLGIVFLGSIIIPFILAVIGGFPRWSPPYLGTLLVGFVFFGPFWGVWGLVYPSVNRWWGNMYTWSLTIRIFVQGMQAAIIWLLVLLAVFIVVSLLRLWPYTRTLWHRIRQDWTQFSFFLYGGLVIHILLIFDEYRYDEPWLMAAWLVLAAGCWLYLHSKEQYQRILILICGATLAMWIVAAGKWYLVPLQSWEPWFERYPRETERWFESLRTLADWFCLIAALMAPALLTLLPRKEISISQEGHLPA